MNVVCPHTCFGMAAHGGGKRCAFEGCTRSSVTRSGEIYCVKHGGGPRCQFADGCNKSAVGHTQFCVKHGGGRRIEASHCSLLDIYSPDPVAHSLHPITRHPLNLTQHLTQRPPTNCPGVRCSVEGCPNSADLRTRKCRSHGGGKRCCEAGCARSVVGGSERCREHGGGRLCQFDGCSTGPIECTHTHTHTHLHSGCILSISMYPNNDVLSHTLPLPRCAGPHELLRQARGRPPLQDP